MRDKYQNSSELSDSTIITLSSEYQTDCAANKNYYLYKQNIMCLAAMGAKYHLFSISWTRILPFGLPGTLVNSYGIKHYGDLIGSVLEQGMLPVVTPLHFDTPL